MPNILLVINYVYILLYFRILFVTSQSREELTQQNIELVDCKFDRDLYKKLDFLEKEISYKRAKASWKVIEPLTHKHNIDFQCHLNKEFFEDLSDDPSTQQCKYCPKKFQSSNWNYLHHLRKHSSLPQYQEQFLMVESLYKFAKRDENEDEANKFEHREPEFRKCLRFANSFMDNLKESDDFCLDLIYGARDDNSGWKETISQLWESIAMILFMGLTGLFYYYIFFVMKSKKEEDEKDHHKHMNFD